MCSYTRKGGLDGNRASLQKKNEDRSPPEGPNEGPPGGLTWRKLVAEAIKLSLALLKIVDWLTAWLTTLM